MITIEIGGKTFDLDQPSSLQNLDFIDALGMSAANPVYLNMVYPLVYVKKIDGIAVPPCGTKEQVRALYQRVGEESLVDIAKAIEENFNKKTDEETIASAKKSPATADSDKSSS